jgi:hypothetical protein
MLRVSLREMLVAVALVALAIVSLTYASLWWRLGVVSLLMVVFTAAAIEAFVDRGARQAFAIGMLVTLIIYAGLIAYGRRDTDQGVEGDFSLYGQLPTSRLLRLVHQGIATQRYVNARTGEELPDFDPQTDRAAQGGRRFSAPGRIVATRVDTPTPGEFMKIGHCWWALLFGYIGGRFGRFVDKRRTTEEKPLAAQPP